MVQARITMQVRPRWRCRAPEDAKVALVALCMGQPVSLNGWSPTRRQRQRHRQCSWIIGKWMHQGPLAPLGETAQAEGAQAGDAGLAAADAGVAVAQGSTGTAGQQSSPGAARPSCGTSEVGVAGGDLADVM